MGVIMTQAKINCWEFKQCGKEPGGKNAAEGVCPVAVEQGADGVHSGMNAGRCCWVIPNNLCHDDMPQKNIREQNTLCLQCDFYHMVRTDEIPAFKVTGVVLSEIKRNKAALSHA
ncbi:two-CW domain-containing protein [Candidatus Electrothrix sp.]|uniref:two-CW domain-containing protein n=2 Tax=Candidatus Electrothrix sp. TaxID=2170559 RepID=UPI004057B3E9